MKVRGSILALGAFFVLAVAVAGCGSGVPGNSVADVAGNPITTQAFNHWMFVAAKSQAAEEPGQPVIVPNDPPQFTKCIADVRKAIPSLAKTKAATLRTACQQQFTSLSSSVMDFLITAYWYQADAHKLGVKVTNAEVQNAFAAAKKQTFPTAAGFNSFLSETGQTLDDIVYRFKINTIVQKLVARYTKPVTQANIVAYYNSHPTQFSTQESRDMRIVLTTSSAQADAAKKALQSGQSWTTVAKKYSTDPTTKNNGGLLTGVTQGQQDAALTKAAFAAPVNQLIGPVKGQFGYYVVEVTKVTPATHKTLAEATKTIKSQLTTTQSQTAQTAVANQAKKDWLSQTTCRAEYAMADCKGYKAPKTATTGTSTGTAGTSTAG
ncbi:MAG TPA: peptidyl-prolyl cis-trans isomerase [Solirubrobacteraceae bacterium]|nr:peptidyl-prolyl cis-trans isomerase [Solirubrobacteraceae bacterium]